MNELARIASVCVPAAQYATVVAHARRKLQGDYHAGETPERKAFGLVAGWLSGDRAEVTRIFPLARNMRHQPCARHEMDAVMAALAVRSETPLVKRGWVADPAEVLAAHRWCEETGSVAFGAYHMHRIAWPHDLLRDTCTAVDTALARRSGLWVLVVSMVNPARPIVRAFFEGDNAREARVVVGHRVDRRTLSEGPLEIARRQPRSCR